MSDAPAPWSRAGPRAQSLHLFLRLVHDRGLYRVGIDDYLQVERLVASRRSWQVGQLANALAALLATGEESWREIHTLARESLSRGAFGGLAVGSDHEDDSETEGAPRSPDEPPPDKPRWRRLLPAVAVVLTALAVGILPILLSERPDEVKPSPPLPAPVPVEEAPRETFWTLVEREPERQATETTRPVRRSFDFRDALAFAAGLVLLILALRWWWLPTSSRRRRQKLLDQAMEQQVKRRDDERERGYAERAVLAQELLDAGETWLVPFKVPLRPAVSWRAIDDAAVILGRLQEELPGRDELDAEATVASTLDAGGRAVPVFEQGRSPSTLLVLVDDEGSGHPYLRGFERVLDRWERRGVRLLRFTFHEQPDPLWPHPRGGALSFDVLSRRYAGLPLVIFSRRLTHRDVDAAGAGWTARLEAWPVKAWIDPDPTPPSEPTRRPGFRQDIDGLHRFGLVRFGLDEEDLPILARFLAAGGEGIHPPKSRPLPDSENPPIAAALRAWAVAAARVPEADWDLLEHLRSMLHDEIGRWLPERRHVALLIRFVNARQRTPQRRHRSYLEIEDAELEKLRREQVEADRALPEEKRFLRRVAQMLREELEATQPEDELRLLKLRWELKCAELELVAEPKLAVERLARFRGGPVDALAERSARALVAEGVLEGEERERLLRVWVPAEAEARKAEEGVSPSELLRGHWVLWRRAASVVAVVLALGFVVGLRGRQVLSRGLVDGVGEFFLAQSTLVRADMLPKTSLLVAMEGQARPAMVLIPAGSFLMGSPKGEKGRSRDEARHRVKISRDFYIARTEVTQAQYRAVMGTNPSRDTACGDECPVENVSWFDAVRYANKLSQLEGLEECYELGEREDVVWPRELDCGGYRLPTEAEWEYTARAGSTGRYAGTDNPVKVCKYGNVADLSLERANPEWRFDTFECDDGQAGLAPVATFEANAFKVFDLTGNVFEWVWDWYNHEYHSTGTDPVGPTGGLLRVIRGGSFDDVPQFSRVAYRVYVVPSKRYAYLGFRVARSFP